MKLIPSNPAVRWSLSCALLLLLLSGCSRRPAMFAGYAEGEFVYVASPFGGQLVSLKVQRGEKVKEEAELFELDSRAERAQRDGAESRYLQAKAALEDLLKGKRPSEISALEAQLHRAEAELEFAEKNFRRLSEAVRSRAVSKQAFDEGKSRRDQGLRRVAELKANLETAKLGGRADQIAGAEEEVRARKAELEQAEWQLGQKKQRAPEDGLVFDTLFREGEFIPGGQPVVVLLPPKNIKVRTFVPETMLAKIRTGEKAEVHRDGMRPAEGVVSYISPHAEYTPPVIYSRESRAKLVFMVEVSFPPEIAKDFHPGQPVEVRFK